MKKTITRLFLLTFILLGFTVQSQNLLLNEQFNYTVGDTLGSHGWTTHSGSTNPIAIVSGSLSYTGYPASAGNMVFLNSSGEDMNHTFTTQTAGTNIYYAALINVATATTTGDYFMHLKGASTTYPGRVYIKKDSITNKYKVGLLKGFTAANTVYSTTEYDFATTTLLVLKYSIIAGTANDNVSLFVNPAIGAEGTPTITATDVSSPDLDSTSQAIGLRQGGSTVAPTLNVDEIRVATTWSDVLGLADAGIHVTEATKFNVYPNPTNGKFTLTMDKATDVDIKLFAIDGRMILNKTSNQMTNEIDISSFGKGMYFITISDLKTMKTTTEKLVVN